MRCWSRHGDVWMIVKTRHCSRRDIFPVRFSFIYQIESSQSSSEFPILYYFWVHSSDIQYAKTATRGDYFFAGELNIGTELLIVTRNIRVNIIHQSRKAAHIATAKNKDTFLCVSKKYKQFQHCYLCRKLN